MSIEYRDEIMIDRRSTKPIYKQIYAQLENFLSSARVINNEAIIKPYELAKIINVSLEEVEKVYELLEKNKFIKFGQDNKPYVVKYARILNFFSKLIFIEDGIKSLGKEPGCPKRSSLKPSMPKSNHFSERSTYQLIASWFLASNK